MFCATMSVLRPSRVEESRWLCRLTNFVNYISFFWPNMGGNRPQSLLRARGAQRSGPPLFKKTTHHPSRSSFQRVHPFHFISKTWAKIFKHFGPVYPGIRSNNKKKDIFFHLRVIFSFRSFFPPFPHGSVS